MKDQWGINDAEFDECLNGAFDAMEKASGGEDCNNAVQALGAVIGALAIKGKQKGRDGT